MASPRMSIIASTTGFAYFLRTSERSVTRSTNSFFFNSVAPVCDAASLTTAGSGFGVSVGVAGFPVADAADAAARLDCDTDAFRGLVFALVGAGLRFDM